MKRELILKKAIETGEFKKIILSDDDVKILLKIFMEFLKNHNYSSAEFVLNKFIDEKDSNILNSIDEDRDWNRYNPIEWEEIESCFKTTIQNHLIELIESDDFINFKSSINTWLPYHIRHGCTVFARSMVVDCLDFVAEKSIKNGKDKWILSVIENIKSSNTIYSLIKKYLIQSKTSIKKKAIRKLISVRLNDSCLGFYPVQMYYDTELILEAKQYSLLSELLLKINDFPKYIFQTLLKIYEYNQNIFLKILKLINSRKSSHENISLMGLKILVLKGFKEEYSFLIKDVVSFTNYKYTARILSGIIKFKRIEIQKKNQELYSKKYYKLKDLAIFLDEACVLSIILASLSSFSFDLLSFINRYNLNFRDIVNKVFELIDSNYCNHKIQLYIALSNYFKDYIENDAIAEEDKLIICDRFISCLRAKESEMFENCKLYFRFVGNQISHVIQDDLNFNNAIIPILNETHPIYDFGFVFIDKMSREKAYLYVLIALFYNTFIVLKKTSKINFDFDFNHLLKMNVNISYFLKKKYEIPYIDNDKINFTDQIKLLLLFKKQADDLISLGHQDVYCSIISNAISNMINHLNILAEEEKIEQIAEARIEEQKKMLSYLTHTLRNTLSAGPEIAKTITENLRDIFGDQYTKNPKVEKTINRASSLLTTFNYVDNLIETFKLFSGDKTEISNKWKNENDEEVNIKVLLAKTLIQVTSKILFYNSYLSERKKLFKKENIKQIKESFLDLILINFDSEEEAEIVFQWFQKNCPTISIKTDDVLYKMKIDGLRFGILFSIISELIFNSTIYFDDNGKIEISITENNDTLEFLCENHYNETKQESKGTNKGFSFIKHIITFIDVLSLQTNKSKGVWTSKLIINKTK